MKEYWYITGPRVLFLFFDSLYSSTSGQTEQASCVWITRAQCAQHVVEH